MRRFFSLFFLVSVLVMVASLPVAAHSGTSPLVSEFTCSGNTLSLVLQRDVHQHKMDRVLWNAKFTNISQYPWNHYFNLRDAQVTKTKRYTWADPDRHGDWAFRFNYRFTFQNRGVVCDTVVMRIRLPRSGWGYGWSGDLRP